MVSSMIHYKPREEQARRVRQKWIDERGAEAFQIPKRYGVPCRWDCSLALFMVLFVLYVRVSVCWFCRLYVFIFWLMVENLA